MSNSLFVKLLILLLSICPIFVKAQQVRVFNAMTPDFPLNGVAIYNLDSTRATETDSNGLFELSIFDSKDSLFFEHPIFELAFYSYQEIMDSDYEIGLDPSDDLLQELGTSVLNVEENSLDLPFVINIVDSEDKSETLQDPNDMLSIMGKMMVQKNQEGGTPILRGLESNKILLVLDGVRLNNIIYRNGSIPNSLTFDNAVLERSQTIYGTSTFIYSNDALGGVVHYLSKRPKLSKHGFVYFGLQSNMQYSTANDTKIGHIDLNLGFKKIGSFTSFTYSDYGIIKVGKKRVGIDDEYWGLRKNYISQQNGIDTMLLNPNPEKQLHTDYKQYDVIQKILFVPHRTIEILAGIYYSTTSEIGIYSGLIEYNGNNLRFAECKFLPQDKVLGSISFLFKNANLFFTNFSLLASYQKIEEKRYTRKYKNPKGLYQLEDVDVYTVNMDFAKLIGSNRLIYGLEYSINQLNSNAYSKNIFNDSIYTGLNRYPTHGSESSTYSVYVNYKWNIHPQFIASSSFRIGYHTILSKFSTDKPNLDLHFESIRMENICPAGSLDLMWYPLKGTQLNLITSSGSHVPIVDDFGKVMAQEYRLLIPNDSLQADYSYNVELGLTQTFFQYFRFNLTGFSTWIENAIIRTATSLNGMDSISFGSDRYQLVTNSNIGKAQIRGFSSSIELNWNIDEAINHLFRFKANVNLIEGKRTSDNLPLPNVSPTFGQVSAAYRYQWFETGVSYIFNTAKKYSELSPYGEDLIDKATLDGFPEWQSFNCRFSIRFNQYLNTQFAVNNIFDTFYRTYSSAVSSPGRNFVFTVRFKF